MLHDIGKFYQRADTGSVASSRYLKTSGKDERAFCPTYHGQYTHKHVLWTAQFIEDHAIVFNKLSSGSDLSNLSVPDNLINISAGHHLNASQISALGRIVKEADCLSSGMERDSEDALRDDQDERQWDAFKKKRMISILQTIDGSSSSSWKHIPVGRMSLTKSSFPHDTFPSTPDYTRMWEEFIGEFKFIQANTYHAFSETLLNLLYKYTTSIPSSTIHFPDISLYDHLKTTAAIALCLYDLMESGEKPSDRFLLIGAGLSGIQSYIYQVVSKYAGKNLKGRSFYLRILSDAVVRYLLKSLGLYQANVIYNSGGGFYILAPNTSEMHSKLKKAITEIEKHIFDTHHTSLYVAIDYVPLSDDALMHRNGQSLSDAWGKLFVKSDAKKYAKYASMLSQRYEEFFTPMQIGGETPVDRITGEEFAKNEAVCKEGELSPLKLLTKQQIVLGKQLRDYDVMVVFEESIPYWSGRNPLNPGGLGFYYYLLKNKDIEEKKDILRQYADKVTLVTPNGENGNCDFLGNAGSIDNIFALDFYGGNELVNDKVVTFEEMCERHYSSESMKRLGILRMDVDSLGSIFLKGIPPERASLSRYATLSRSFDFFFSGYLNSIWHELNPERSIILYSGGDDLFIVASWEVAIEFAKHIREDFRDYACDNKAFSISGGVVLVPPKFPIMKAAELAAVEEKRAKEHVSGGQQKNSISILGMPLNWDNEFPAVEKLKDSIVEMKIDDALTKSFITKVLTHAANAGMENHKITSYKTYWMITYDLCRMRGRVSDPKAKALLQTCIKDVCGNGKTLNGSAITTNYHALELWALACRWAELELRTYKL